MPEPRTASAPEVCAREAYEAFVDAPDDPAVFERLLAALAERAGAAGAHLVEWGPGPGGAAGPRTVAAAPGSGGSRLG